MPRDSNWNTAVVLPLRKKLVGALRRRAAASRASKSACRIEPAHVAQRPVEDGQRGEAEEVELHQADRLDVVLVELRDQRVGALGARTAGRNR